MPKYEKYRNVYVCEWCNGDLEDSLEVINHRCSNRPFNEEDRFWIQKRDNYAYMKSDNNA